MMSLTCLQNQVNYSAKHNRAVVKQFFTLQLLPLSQIFGTFSSRQKITSHRGITQAKNPNSSAENIRPESLSPVIYSS